MLFCFEFLFASLDQGFRYFDTDLRLGLGDVGGGGGQLTLGLAQQFLGCADVEVAHWNGFFRQ